MMQTTTRAESARIEGYPEIKSIPYTEKRKEGLVLLVERAEEMFDDLEALLGMNHC